MDQLSHHKNKKQSNEGKLASYKLNGSIDIKLKLPLSNGFTKIQMPSRKKLCKFDNDQEHENQRQYDQQDQLQIQRTTSLPPYNKGIMSILQNQPPP